MHVVPLLMPDDPQRGAGLRRRRGALGDDAALGHALGALPARLRAGVALLRAPAATSMPPRAPAPRRSGRRGPGPAVDFIASLRNQGHPVGRALRAHARRMIRWLPRRARAVGGGDARVADRPPRPSRRQGALDREDAPPPAHDRDALAPLAGGARRAHRARPARRGAVPGGHALRQGVGGRQPGARRPGRPGVAPAHRDRPAGHDLRYEDLVTEPEQELRRVSAVRGRGLGARYARLARYQPPTLLPTTSGGRSRWQG